MAATATRTDKLQAAHERLTQAVEAIVTGEDWKRMLKVASKFHRYSFNNQLLIFLQRPDATLVAGFRRWQELGRQVRKGEKGIAILAPCKYRVPSEDGPSAASGLPSENGPAAASSDGKDQAAPAGDRPRTEVRGFRVAYVFDVSQTDGEPIEDLDAVRPRLLQGEVPEGLWDALVAQANDAGFEVVREQRGNENGYCDFGSCRIGIRPDVGELQAVKTLVHELAHALVHGDAAGRPDREIAEVEVESVAFVVCDALGLDTSDYSFSYVAGWARGSLELVRETADRVVSCAKEILGALEMTPDVIAKAS